MPLKLLISGLCSAANRDVGYCPCVICICGTSQQSCLEIVMTGMLACLSAAGLEKSVCQYAMLCLSLQGSSLLSGALRCWLERGCSLCEGGQSADLTAQAFPRD